MQRKQWFALAALLALAGAALADTPNVDNVIKNFEIASNGVSQRLVVLAQRTAVAALAAQWVIGYWKDLFKPDIPNALLKAVGMITWFGGSIYLLGHVDLIAGMFKGYLALAGELSGVTGDFTPLGVIVKGRDVIDATHAGIAAKLGGNWFAFGQNMLASGTLLIVDVIVIAAFLFMGLSLFVVNVEFWLIFAVAPLAFGLIPLQAFRDQGIAPIKGVISVGLRVLILGVIISVAQSLGDTLIASINKNGIPGDPNSTSVLARMLEYLAGMLGCAAMAMYSGKIASAIASGSASFTGSDAMAAGGAMIAGAGAAVAAGAGAAAGAKAAGAGLLNGAKGAQAMGSNAMARAAANPLVSPTGGAPESGGGGAQPFPPSRPSFEGSKAGGGAGGEAPRQPLYGGSGTGAGGAGAGGAGAGGAEAGIGGAGEGGAGNGGASALDKFNHNSSQMVENLKQDHSAVSVNINLGGER